MQPPRPTQLAHLLLSDVIRKGDSVIDATCGNGHDTMFLAALVGEEGKVIAYDIQEAAIRETQALAKHAGFDSRITCHLKSHARMAEDLEPESVRAVAFNLGYLPGEDHALTTEADETLKALEAATGIIEAEGGLSVICYPGHEAGAIEAEAVEKWFSALPEKGWRVAKYAMLGTQKPAPFLLLGVKGG
ncbi:MAG: class I SAM-dependent methyltransferase [Akkermansiaceae bacterium]|nr:class I SAM-dependent methyltransferase [Akkermansiaceae bacterium]